MNAFRTPPRLTAPWASALRRVLLVLSLVLLSVSAWAAYGQPAAGGVGTEVAGGAQGGVGKPLQPPHERAAIIKVSGEVDGLMLSSLRRRIDIAQKTNCSLIVFDIDTPGGIVAVALFITQDIKNLKMATVAYINPRAYSAGAMIALACQQMVMAPSAAVGDAQPIRETPDGIRGMGPDADVRAKILSPVVKDLEDSAHLRGYNALLARGMADRELIIYALDRVDAAGVPTGEVRMADPKDKDRLLAETQDVGGRKAPLWKLQKDPIKDDKHLLILDTPDALKYGFAKATINSEEDLLAKLNIRGVPLRMGDSWFEELVRFFALTSVRGVLFVIMLVLAYIEFAHPGITIAGVGALLCLAIIVGAPYLTGLAQVWEIALIVIGVAIIAVDLVVYGGLGLFAVPGFILMAIGLVASFVPMDPGGGWPTTPRAWRGLQAGLSVVIFGSLCALGIFYLLSRYLYLTPGFRRLQLAPPVTTDDLVVLDAASAPTDEAVFVGALGVAASDLRPAGKARFDRHVVDVVTQGGFVEQGTTVTVVAIEGPRVVVKPQAAT